MEQWSPFCDKIDVRTKKNKKILESKSKTWEREMKMFAWLTKDKKKKVR